jgi:hypothetical protein
LPFADKLNLKPPFAVCPDKQTSSVRPTCAPISRHLTTHAAPRPC